MQNAGVRSLLAVPVMTAGTVAGVLGLETVHKEKFWSEKDLALLKTVGEIIGSAIERKRSEVRLKESEERLALALQVSNEGVWDWDLRTDEAYFSPRYFSMLGYEPDALPGTFDTWVGLLHPDDRDEALAEAEKLSKSGENFEFEFRMRTREGDYLHILSRGQGVLFGVEGRPMRLVGTHMDITERKKAEEELRYREAFESLIAGISTEFVGLPPEKTASGIESALRKLGEFAGGDRSYVFFFTDDGAKMDNSHEWCAEGIISQQEHMQGFPLEDLPWAMAKIKARQVLYIPSMADLPPEAQLEKEHWEKQGVQSLVCVTILSGGSVIGVLGFHFVRFGNRYAEKDIALLTTVSEIIGTAIERKRSEARLKESEERFALALQVSNEGGSGTGT